MERAKRKTTTTTTRTTTRRTRNLSTATADSVPDTEQKTGRIKAVRATAANKDINDQVRKRKTENSNMNSTAVNAAAALNHRCNSDSTEVSNCSSDQKRLHQFGSRNKVKIVEEDPKSGQCSPIKVLKKSRSEPFDTGGESSEIELLRKVKSENYNSSTDTDEVAHSTDLDAAAAADDNEKVGYQEDELSMRMEDVSVDGCEGEEDDDEMTEEDEVKTEHGVAEMAKNDCVEETEEVILYRNDMDNEDNKSGDDQVDRVNGGEDEGEQRMNVVDSDHKDLDQIRDTNVGGGGGGGGDELVQLRKNKSKRVLSPLNTKLLKSVVDGEVESGDGGKGEVNKIFDNGGEKDVDQAPDDSGGGSGGGEDEVVKLKNKTKRVLSPPIVKSNLSLPKSSLATKSTPSPPTTTTSASHERPTSRSIHKPTPKSPIPPTTARDVSSKQYDGYTTPETHSKLQSLVDLVLWKDVSKTAFIFGFGTFIIISSSYAKDFNFSFISFTSYMSLVYLAVVFLYKSFMNREMMDKEDWPEKYVWGEEEAMWLVKLVLPYMNEFLLKLRGIFSGDPAMTMKLAVVLFVLARCGSSITLWKTIKLGFFGVFVVPKLCSSYSPQITAYGNFWVGRFRDVWESCSHKKALVFGIFTLVWNFSSIVARAWAAFMLFVALRYYQQSMVTQEFSEEQTESLSHNNVHLRHVARDRGRVPTSLDQRKLKKSC